MGKLNTDDCYTFTFGKYKGQDYHKVPKDYLLWLIESDFMKKDNNATLRTELKYYLTKEYVFAFGKHKDMPLHWVINNDMKYLEWLINSEFLNKNPSLKGVIELALELESKA